MAGEAPAGAAVHAGGGEGGEAQLVLAGGDVFHNGLQGVKVGDLGDVVACLSQQSLVDDDAVALVAVADGAELSVRIIEHVLVGVQLIGNGGAGEIQAVVAPGVNSGLVANHEHGGGLTLVHLGGQGIVVGTGGSGDNLDRNTGLLGVHGGQLLQSLVRFGLEVQPVDGALCGRGFSGGFSRGLSGGCLGGGGGGGAAAGAQREHHDQCQKHCDGLFHFTFSPFVNNFLV